MNTDKLINWGKPTLRIKKQNFKTLNKFDMKYIIKYSQQFKQWILYVVSGSSIDKNADLKSRIKEAKEKVIWSEVHGMRFVENYEEIRLLFGYEDTLGMALFVRDYITDYRMTVEKCTEYLDAVELREIEFIN